MADEIKIYPKRLSGELRAMPSKSLSHRAVIGACLAGNSCAQNLGQSLDIQCTLRALGALGFATGEMEGAALHTGPPGRETQESRLVDCGESGSTLRILFPLALDGVPTVFTGSSRLMQRSMTVYQELCRDHRIDFEQSEGQIRVCGKLSHGLFSIRGDISSQFISGLLFALPLCRGDSCISLKTPLQSKAYVDLSTDMLRQFGVQVFWQGEQSIHIPGGQAYQSANITVEGDYSHAAFHLAAGVLGDGTIVKGLRPGSLQGDRAIIDVLRKMRADVTIKGMNCIVQNSRLQGCEIDVSQIPDLFPIISVLAAFAEGESHLVNGARLRDKESDRLGAMAQELSKLGAKVLEKEDELVVYGNGGADLPGGVLCQGHNDHRIVMSLAVAASRCENPVIISDAFAVAKSAPDFWREYEGLGGIYEMEGRKA